MFFLCLQTYFLAEYALYPRRRLGIQVLVGLAPSSQKGGSSLQPPVGKIQLENFVKSEISIGKLIQQLLMKWILQSQKFDKPSYYQMLYWKVAFPKSLIDLKANFPRLACLLKGTPPKWMLKCKFLWDAFYKVILKSFSKQPDSNPWPWDDDYDILRPCYHHLLPRLSTKVSLTKGYF